MEITCSFVQNKEDQGGLPAGYLCIIKRSGQPKYIPYVIFKEQYDRAKNSRDPLSENPNIGSSKDLTSILNVASRPDFADLMRLLAHHLEIQDDELNDTQNELIINSNSATLLELPWEEIVDSRIFVIRRVENENNLEYFKESANNFLYLLSHSFKGHSLSPIKINLDNEVENIFSLIPEILKEEAISRFKLSNISLSVHTTNDSLKNIRWEEYRYIHIIAHGLNSGKICLECDHDHEIVDEISFSDFLMMIKNFTFRFLFFSFCYSGSGCREGENLAFNAVNNGISKYTIGYSYGVGDESASLFTKCFYHHLLNKKDETIENTYKKALGDYYRSRGTTKYIPLLFASIN